MRHIKIELKDESRLKRDMRSILSRDIFAHKPHFPGQEPKINGIDLAIIDIVNHLKRNFLTKEDGTEIVTISKHELDRLRVRNRKWEELSEEVGQYYETEDNNFDPVPPKKKGDLGDIGEIAARKLGYL